MAQSVERIPNKNLYQFVARKGFKDEAESIRHMKFTWPCSYDTTPRNGYLILLLKEKNLWEEFLDGFWPSGRSVGGEKEIQRCVKKAKEYDSYVASEADFKNANNPVTSCEVSKLNQYALNQILCGPPGTGKTYETANIAVNIADPVWFFNRHAAGDDAPSREEVKKRYDELVMEKRIVFTTFHQSFSYEDFIEGIRAESDDSGALRYEVQDGVFKKLCTAAGSEGESSKQHPYVLIIDEINRGNISRIFGELITLLEPEKRKGASDAREVVLPYSKERFSVPENLYVVGTMNTADKSLAQLDLALRRRFSFVEMQPNPGLLSDTYIYGVDVAEMLAVINQRIEVLLERDHLIGHSYFLPLAKISDTAAREKELQRIFQKQIVPLLQEYFFDDWERISWVLNDNAKSDGDRFIRSAGMKHLDGLFCAEVAEKVSDRRFYVNSSAFNRADAYIGILPGSRSTVATPGAQELDTTEV